MDSIKKNRTITIDSLSERYETELTICPSCETKTSLLKQDIIYIACPSCNQANVVNFMEFKRKKSVANIDTLTLLEWSKLLPSMIDIQIRHKKQPHIAGALTRQLVRVMRLLS